MIVITGFQYPDMPRPCTRHPHSPPPGAQPGSHSKPVCGHKKRRPAPLQKQEQISGPKNASIARFLGLVCYQSRSKKTAVCATLTALLIGPPAKNFLSFAPFFSFATQPVAYAYIYFSPSSTTLFSAMFALQKYLAKNAQNIGQLVQKYAESSPLPPPFVRRMTRRNA